MKYQNAEYILPEELVRAIQEYAQGEYLYIPARNRSAPSATDYRVELEKRDARIYSKHLLGMKNQQLAEKYSLSESSIRRIIRKKRRTYTRMIDTLPKILCHWGLQNEKLRQLHDTAWQVGNDYVLKNYHSLETLERNLGVTELLSEMQIPVGKIILTNDGRQYVAENGLFYFLAEKLPGNSPTELEQIEKAVFLMGEAIARLHIAFKRCEHSIPFWNNSLLDEMTGWVRNGLEDGGWKYATKKEYETSVSRLAAVYGQLPIQPIHRDVHFGNFLFADGQFSGYIDFDLSQKNIRIFDLCYFLLGLLSEEEKLDITEEQWISFVGDVFAGYSSKLDLSPEERAAVPYVMECIELLFISYFCGIQDVRCAEDGYKLFQFVQRLEDRILAAVNAPSAASGD